jgi:hypothetical protein
MTSSNFGQLVRDGLEAINRQRQEDKEIFQRLCEAIDRYPGRERDSHELVRQTETSGELRIGAERITGFSVKDGKVIVGQETVAKAVALALLAERTAKAVTAIDDDRQTRRDAPRVITRKPR